MDDFLQGLRSRHTEKQRVVMTRKNYDAVYDHPGHRNGGQYMSRPAQSYYSGNRMPVVESVPSRLKDAVKTLNTHMESFAENQKYLINAQEKTAVMLERQVISLEKLLGCLNILPE